MMSNFISYTFLILGIICMVIGTVGIIIMPDLYTRIHAAGITDTVGLSFICLSMFISFDYNLKFILLIFFMWISTPLSSYLLCQMAYNNGLKPIGDDKSDEFSVQDCPESQVISDVKKKTRVKKK